MTTGLATQLVVQKTFLSHPHSVFIEEEQHTGACMCVCRSQRFLKLQPLSSGVKTAKFSRCCQLSALLYLMFFRHSLH